MVGRSLPCDDLECISSCDDCTKAHKTNSPLILSRPIFLFFLSSDKHLMSDDNSDGRMFPQNISIIIIL